MKNGKRYDKTFKQDAVNLALASEQSFRKTAEELGVPAPTLCRWINNHKLGRHKYLSDKSALSPEEITLKETLKELSIITEERDLLKKALGIFSQPENS